MSGINRLEFIKVNRVVPVNIHVNLSLGLLNCPFPLMSISELKTQIQSALPLNSREVLRARETGSKLKDL